MDLKEAAWPILFLGLCCFLIVIFSGSSRLVRDDRGLHEGWLLTSMLYNGTVDFNMTHNIEPADEETCLFFMGSQIIVGAKTRHITLPFRFTVDTLNLKIISLHCDNDIKFIHCDRELHFDVHEDYEIISIKKILSEVDAKLESQILRAYHCLNWDKQSQYCGQCGAKLESQSQKTEKKCLACNVSVFPRFSPAVMVLIRKGNQLLLARSPHFPPGVYSAIAGFIDVGESAEAAAHREVKEELGIEISDLEYFGTQPWPFPDSFMIAFKATYLQGELELEVDEIEDAGWFSPDDLPAMPPSASIARKLIESSLADCRKII